MINLLIPLAGKGQRFIDMGYKIPKALITVGNKTNIEWSLQSLKYSNNDVRLIFVIRPDQDANYNFGYILKSMFGENIIIKHTNGFTRGAVETCLAAINEISTDEPLAIYCPDVYFEPKIEINKQLFENNDGSILVFKANSTAYSYVKFDDDLKVQRTAEKQIISPYAAAGLYLFKSGNQFLRAAFHMINNEETTQNEYYICPLYNSLIYDGSKVTIQTIEKVHIFGTPAEMNFFVKNTLRTFKENKKTVGLCADHSGFETKETMKKVLELYDIPYIDFGTFSPQDCDYSVYVNECAEAVLDNRCSLGIGFCRTGQGVNIAANHIPGIRSALVYDDISVEYAIRHNCANFFSIPTRIFGPSDKLSLEQILVKWKENTFDGGRHQNRLQETEL